MIVSEEVQTAENEWVLFIKRCVQRTCIIQITRVVGPGSKFLDNPLLIGLILFWAYDFGLGLVSYFILDK